MKRTDYYWLRLVGTGLWFLVFGLVTFVLGFVVLPVIRLVTADRARRQRRSRAVLGARHARLLCMPSADFVSSPSNSSAAKSSGGPASSSSRTIPRSSTRCYLLGFAPTASCIVKAGHFRNLITRGAVMRRGLHSERAHRRHDPRRRGRAAGRRNPTDVP